MSLPCSIHTLSFPIGFKVRERAHAGVQRKQMVNMHEMRSRIIVIKLSAEKLPLTAFM